MSGAYNFEWDRNAELNKIMSARVSEDAEELFLSCFEKYIADRDDSFSNNVDYMKVIDTAHRPEEYVFTPLDRAVEMLALVWRKESKWSNETRLYTDRNTEKILKEWREWLTFLPDNWASDNPKILEHVVWAVTLRDTDRGDMLRRNLVYLLEEQYLKPVQASVRNREVQLEEERNLKKLYEFKAAANNKTFYFNWKGSAVSVLKTIFGIGLFFGILIVIVSIKIYFFGLSE